MTTRILTLAAAALVAGASAASAASVAIVTGSFYTSDLATQLNAAGNTVTEISSYDAASLAGFDTLVQDGNSAVDLAALDTWVSGGGNLVLLPWSGLNWSVPASLQIWENAGSGAEYSSAIPAVVINDAASELLAGVSFPGAGTDLVGRITGTGFAAGANAVATWNGGDAFIGWRSYGAGSVVGINMHMITSDTAYDVVNTTWAAALADNAVNFGAPTVAADVPLPAAAPLLALGLAGIGLLGRRRAA